MGRLCLLAVLVFSLCQLADSKEVCFPNLGCFSNDAPFNNAEGCLPHSPEVIQTAFYLYTRQNPDREQLWSHNHRSHVAKHFLADRPTIFIVHGFLTNANNKWVVDMRKAFLEKMDANVIEVNWRKGASNPYYPQAVANTRVVAKEIQFLVERLQHQFGLQLDDIHLIGHSLGAHISGYAGRSLGSKIARITGLDPAGPLFENFSPEVRLGKEDAVFVDVIHTNGKCMFKDGGFGIGIPCGHVDFYPNGGEEQPGCDSAGPVGLLDGFWEYLRRQSEGKLRDDIAERIACSHSRSHAYFIESIRSPCKFTAYPCKNYDDFKNGKCSQCPPEGCNYAGYQASPSRALGNLYLKTNFDFPFCFE